jgi:hypothetical protein
MSNYNQLALYVVSNGNVSPATADTQVDGTDSILVAATSEESALQVASAYDRGDVTQDNLVWHDNKTISVVMLRDSDTGKP